MLIYPSIQECSLNTDTKNKSYRIKMEFYSLTNPSKIKKNKSCRRTASSPAGYILYCNIFIIKPYNIGHTDLDVFVCKSFCHIDIIIQV